MFLLSFRDLHIRGGITYLFDHGAAVPVRRYIPMEYYFSKIQLFDEAQIVTPGLKRKLDRKAKKKLEKLGKQGIFLGRDPTKLLHKAERLQKVSENATPTAEQEIRKKWKIAMLRAQGVKVKDDMTLLKKASDKVRKMKRKRFEKWQERHQQVAQMKQERQAKRQANIQARKEKRLTKKLRKARAKGRVFNLDQN
ncbi:hypothetical protein CSKR_110974 [Clonorchis sinensis]|uniref:Ribosomal RNA-processing protein 14/surfeit locus protein 6 C-terminal domain-containing protein n=1 Tax=Clonorchis sinensis TaxID=79923 RepID=A0A8T1MDX7_CLOSI|nr:hypothetical protein CSKR_110974 [Clonorchis sinensis]